MEESRKGFNIANITGLSLGDYFTFDNLDYATIGNTVIDAEIKWDEYIIYIGAYSRESTQPVTVKSITLKNTDRTFYETESTQDIILELIQDGIYGGYITGVVFTDYEKDISHGTELTLQVQVETGDASVKVINYDINVVVYKTWILPT